MFLAFPRAVVIHDYVANRGYFTRATSSTRTTISVTGSHLQLLCLYTTTMILPTLTAFLLVLPTLVTAGIFPPDTKVKMLDPKGFKRVMKNNVCAYILPSPPLDALSRFSYSTQRTSVVAFVAPWCGVGHSLQFSEKDHFIHSFMLAL